MRPRNPARVVHVSAFYPPHLGGVERVTAALAREQALEGLAVEVLTTTVGAEGAPRCELTDGVRVRRYRSAYVAHTPLSPGLLIGLLRQPRGTLVHVHVAHALVTELVRLACWLRGAEYVVHFHLEVDASGPAGLLLPLYKRWLLGPGLRRAARVLALTDDMAAFLAKAYDVPVDRIAVVRNGVDVSFFGDSRPPRSEGGALRLLFVGRLAPQKNVPRLLKALSLSHDVDVDAVLVGDGEDRSALEHQARSLGLDGVRFVGAQKRDEVIAWMDWADAFVMSSDKEGMPLVALEAMARHLPVLSTDVSGSQELLRDTGLLVPATPQGLSDGIRHLARDSQLRDALAKAGHEKATRHSWPDIASQVADEYERAWSSA